MNTCSTSSLESSDNLWDVRATKTPIRDLKLMTHNAKHSPVSRSSTPRSTIKMLQKVDRTNSFAQLPDSAVLRILSYLSTNDLVRCSRLSRRFYFLSWEPELWRSVVLTGEEIDADLALKTIFRCIYLYCIQKFLQCCVVSMVALLWKYKNKRFRFQIRFDNKHKIYYCVNQCYLFHTTPHNDVSTLASLNRNLPSK